jgi:hypothetical protein
MLMKSLNENEQKPRTDFVREHTILIPLEFALDY